MKAAFDFDLRDDEDVKYKFRNQGIAIVKRKGTKSKYIAIYNYYGCTFINNDGDCTYSSKEYLKENYVIVEEPTEMTLTFRNSQ